MTWLYNSRSLKSASMVGTPKEFGGEKGVTVFFKGDPEGFYCTFKELV